MDNNDDIRDQKQSYLEDVIVNKGYDTEAFLNYLTEIRGEIGIDIDNWSFPDLKKVCADFIQKVTDDNISSSQLSPIDHRRVTTTTKEVEQLEDKEQEVITQSTTNMTLSEPAKNNNNQDSDTKSNNSNNSVKSDYFEQNIKVKESETTIISEQQDLVIQVINPEKHPGGFFSSAYITYKVVTSPLNFSVKRRYSDFEWLRKTLASLYPGRMIPPIPKKNYGDRFNEDFIHKRMRYLQKFLTAMSKNEDIRNSQIFYEFLQIESEDVFEKRKGDAAKIKIPNTVHEIKTTGGIAVCKINTEYENYSENLKNYVLFNETIMGKLSLSYKSLDLEMETVSNRLKEISEYYNQLYFVSEKANESATLKETYKMLNTLMKNWGESYHKQKMLMEYDMREYFSYIRKEFISYKDLVAKMETTKVAFNRADTKLTQKKEEYFKAANISKWELSKEEVKLQNELLKDKNLAFSKMLPKESAHVLSLKQEYGYYLNQIFSEFERMVALNGDRYRTHFVAFSEKHTDLLTDLHVMWADLLSYYTDSYDSSIHRNK